MTEGSALLPPVPAPSPPATDEAGVAELRPRYEDVAQDGRLVLTSLMQGVGAAVWRGMLAKSPAVAAFRAQGILPILRRIVVVGEPGPFSVDEPIHYRGVWRLARDERGDRLFLNMWVEATARSGRTFGPPPAADAPRVLAGRVFAEHVVTRPFAPKEERKVTRFEGFAARGLPEVPEDVHPFEPAEALLAHRGDEPFTVARDVRFGLLHTDSNQHVNSLVYPRLAEEAAVERLGEGGVGLLARAIELRYRKPCFAGDRVPLPLAVVRSGPSLSLVPGTSAIAVAAFGAPEAPHCTAALWLG